MAPSRSVSFRVLCLVVFVEIETETEGAKTDIGVIDQHHEELLDHVLQRINMVMNDVIHFIMNMNDF